MFLYLALFLIVAIYSVDILWSQFFNLLSGTAPLGLKETGLATPGLMISLFFILRMVYRSDKAKGRIKKKIHIFE